MQRANSGGCGRNWGRAPARPKLLDRPSVGIRPIKVKQLQCDGQGGKKLISRGKKGPLIEQRRTLAESKNGGCALTRRKDQEAQEILGHITQGELEDEEPCVTPP